MSDCIVQRVTAAAVFLVAVIAAVVSYVHIEHLAVTHGQTRLAAVLLPLSIDGTVVAASLTMLRSARAGLGTPRLARVMLGLAVTGTVGANIAYGAASGRTGAMLSAAPAVFFIGSVEMAVGMVRAGVSKRVVGAHHAAMPVAAALAQVAVETVTPPPADATAAATAAATGLRQDVRQRTATASDRKRAKAARLVAADPAIAAPDLASRCDVSRRTAERWKRDMTRPRLVAEKGA